MSGDTASSLSLGETDLTLPCHTREHPTFINSSDNISDSNIDHHESDTFPISIADIPNPLTPEIDNERVTFKVSPSLLRDDTNQVSSDCIDVDGIVSDVESTEGGHEEVPLLPNSDASMYQSGIEPPIFEFENKTEYREPEIILSDASLSDNELVSVSPQKNQATTTIQKANIFLDIDADYSPRLPQNLSSNRKLQALGKVSSILSGCVIIEALANLPPLDTGSALYLSERRPLGEVYDTFGPVKSPFYMVVLENLQPVPKPPKKPSKPRIRARNAKKHAANNNQLDSHPETPTEKVKLEDLSSKSHNTASSDLAMHSTSQETKKIDVDVSVGDTVYFVADDPALSIPILCSALSNLRGSDASGLNDKELSPDMQEFSDDEKERQFKRKLKSKRPFSTVKREASGDDCTAMSQFQAKGTQKPSRRHHLSSANSAFTSPDSNPRVRSDKNFPSSTNSPSNHSGPRCPQTSNIPQWLPSNRPQYSPPQLRPSSLGPYFQNQAPISAFDQQGWGLDLNVRGGFPNTQFSYSLAPRLASYTPNLWPGNTSLPGKFNWQQNFDRTPSYRPLGIAFPSQISSVQPQLMNALPPGQRAFCQQNTRFVLPSRHPMDRFSQVGSFGNTFPNERQSPLNSSVFNQGFNLPGNQLSFPWNQNY